MDFATELNVVLCCVVCVVTGLRWTPTNRLQQNKIRMEWLWIKLAIIKSTSFCGVSVMKKYAGRNDTHKLRFKPPHSNRQNDSLKLSGSFLVIKDRTKPTRSKPILKQYGARNRIKELSQMCKTNGLNPLGIIKILFGNPSKYITRPRITP